MYSNIRTFLKYRELLYYLTSREIKARYKQSILGFFWVILYPFIQMLVMTFIFSIIVKIPSLGMPYAIFLYVALLPWNFLSMSLSSSVNSLVNNSSLITKIYFPREILVYATIIAKMVDFILASSIFILLLIYYKIPFTIMILWVPVIFIIQFIFILGISLILSALNLFYRDIQYVLNFSLLLWMYITPVLYPVELIPQQYRFLLSLNPMAVIINAYRMVILGGGAPNTTSLFIAFCFSVAIFTIGFMTFKKLEGVFADIV